MRNLLFSVSDSDSNSISNSDGGKQPVPRPRKIFFSDVEVTGTRKQWERKWRTVDIQVASWVFSVHFLVLFAPFTFSWDALLLAFIGYLLTGLLGITVTFHRLLAHRSFKLPKWLEYTFVYFGVLAAQRDPIFWVSMHRYHHQFVDSERDTHSPINGFWFSHMGWLFDSGYIFEKYRERKNVEDLRKQPFFTFIKRTYMWHIFALAILLYAWGGFPYLVWGMGVRTVWVYHLTFFVNSACHIWGYQTWNTGDLSKNNWWVAILTFGEGWHNNHHAFEFSARHGLEWWQLDVSWYVIRFLEAIGLATNVKLPSESHKLRKSLMNPDKTLK